MFHSIIDNIDTNKKQALNPGSSEIIEGSRSDGKINKREVIRIQANEKRFPCCYI